MKRGILQKILGVLTKKIVGKYKPKVIAITGSVGKTSTKNAIALLFERYFTIWGKSGNLNTEFGVPLTFIGVDKGGEGSFSEWVKIIFAGVVLIFKKKRNYPEIVITEMGADKPGDISYLTSLVSPDISVVTRIGDVPVHIQNYKGIEDLINEKAEIVENTKPEGFVILNYDDISVRAMGKKTKAKPIYFGFGKEADVIISEFNIETKVSSGKKIPYGSSFELAYNNISQRIHLPYCIGKPFAYSVAAALAAGIAAELDLGRIADIFRDLKPEEGRMNLIETQDYLVLNDTYNSSPASVESALETIKDLPVERKIAVLGDMRELGSESLSAHRKIGEIVSQVCDVLITVGDQSEEIKNAALSKGMNLSDVSHFKSTSKVIGKIKSIAKPGDLILVKGSRSLKMEEIVREIT